MNVAFAIYTDDFARLDDALDEFPGETPSLATNPDATALNDTGHTTHVGHEIGGSMVGIVGGEDLGTLGIVDLDTPTRAIVVAGNLHTNTGWLGVIDLLGLFVLAVL